MIVYNCRVDNQTVGVRGRSRPFLSVIDLRRTREKPLSMSLVGLE